MANDLALLKKDTVDVVTNKIRQFLQSGELHLPPNYSAENALKAAWLILQSTVDKQKRPVLQVCTKDSIANSLLDMVVQGLNPAKKQCYFVAYGNKLVCMRSYFGSMALVKRVIPDAEIWFGAVYEGDEFEYEIERGKKRIRKHIQKIENVKPEKIVAAYCVIERSDGRLVHTEIMTFDQIKQAWKQGQSYREAGDGDGTHQKFPDQMAVKTVINRACKYVINSASDDYLFLHHFNRSDEEAAEAQIEAEVAANANGRVIDVEPLDTADAESAVEEQDAEPEPEEAPPAEEPLANGRATAGAEQLSMGPGF